MKALKYLNDRYNDMLLKLAGRIARKHGLLIVKIVNIANTNYILNNDGSMQRIGGKK
jgi:hypothetical protein